MSDHLSTEYALTADDGFAGAGGWDLAARALGIHARGVEIMPEARATREAAGLTTIHDDVWTFVPDGRAKGKIDSPPCPTFSPAGKGTGRKALDSVLCAIDDGAYRDLDQLREYPVSDDDDRTRLVLTPLHFATQYEYEWLAWEQVPTVLPVWEACAEVLRAQGWHVWTGKLHSEQYGVPQTRTRAFLLASRRGPVAPPTPTHSRYHTNDPSRLDQGVHGWMSMAEGLGWGLLGRPSYTVVGGSSHAASGIEWGSSAVRKSLLDAAQDPDAWRAKGWGLTGRPAPTITGGGTETGGAEPIAKLARYTSRPDWCFRSPAPTIAADPRVAPRGCKHPQPGCCSKYPGKPGLQFGPGTIRLEPHEAGILQSFPADYPWQGNRGKQFLQAGNAVPPGMALHALAAASGIAIERTEAVA